MNSFYFSERILVEGFEGTQSAVYFCGGVEKNNIIGQSKDKKNIWKYIFFPE